MKKIEDEEQEITQIENNKKEEVSTNPSWFHQEAQCCSAFGKTGQRRAGTHNKGNLQKGRGGQGTEHQSTNAILVS